MPTREDCAYAAGIIDGEGCVLVGHQPTRYKGKNPARVNQAPYTSYYARVAVSTADDTLVPWLHETFALGTVSQSVVNGTVVLRWILGARDSKTFLRLIFPFLKLKQKQAKIALRFCWLKERAHYARDRKMPRGRGSHATPPSYQRQFQKCKEEIVAERSRRMAT